MLNLSSESSASSVNDNEDVHKPTTDSSYIAPEFMTTRQSLTEQNGFNTNSHLDIFDTTNTLHISVPTTPTSPFPDINVFTHLKVHVASNKMVLIIFL